MRFIAALSDGDNALLPLLLGVLTALGGVLYQHSNTAVLATIGVPGVAFGAWAWVLWWRNRYLQTSLREVSQFYLTHDAVTGLLSHHGIYLRLEEAVRLAEQQRDMLSVMRVDVDRFTLFNATHGAPAGNELLRRIGQIIAQMPASEMVAGRYDADEFLIILPHTAREEATRLAHRLRESIRQTALAHAGNGQAIAVTVSIGIACYPEDATDMQGLLSGTEAALSIARHSDTGVADTHSSWRARYRIHEDGDFSTLEAMIVAIDNKDGYTRRHSEEVTEYALWIAEELGFSEEQKHTLRLAGLVHDVGKIGIPDEVLLKPDVLSPSEYEIVKQHAALGAAMLSALPNMERLAPIVRAHHERWDGTGYPDGLAGEQIPFLARVLAVADAFSAMTTDRPYRKGLDWETALREIERQRGRQFDPAIADAFITAVRKRMEQSPSEQTALPLAA
ncbi:MAG: diguanylate cyclase [Chthonomonadetes bacterium]|nr:diguanylate cyclase [Chthonomonadetes bacterium]